MMNIDGCDRVLKDSFGASRYRETSFLKKIWLFSHDWFLSVVRALALGLKGFRFDSGQGPVSRLQAGFLALAGAHAVATD